MRRALLAAALALLLSIAAPAAAAPPVAGVLVPGKSLGGLRLGATKAQVEKAWGRAYGLCTGCARETWYFNYYAFQPRGAGVEIRAGRAAAIFTIYAPPTWRVDGGLSFGATGLQVRAAYPAVERQSCSGYYALSLTGPKVVTSFYVLDDKLWALSISRPGIPLCR